jgi:preprotein translocase subunit SecD
MNQYPPWKYILIALIVVFSALYALPNIYGKDPAIQVSHRTQQVSELVRYEVEEALKTAGIGHEPVEMEQNSLVVRFPNEEIQLRAQDAVRQALGSAYTVALNLAPATPAWLESVGAEPMFLGLDLRGGVNFLLEVDMDAAIVKADERNVSNLRTLFRDEEIRYRTISALPEGGVLIRFRDQDQRAQGIPC